MEKLREAGYTEEAGFTSEFVKMYKDLRNLLITKYTNNKLGL